ncbi:MAG: hypothetical protein HC897_02840 [Thermoanaerobaculia bacterium]|nr:hypothetical protein [Thermoanaerobaculia bacterium]
MIDAIQTDLALGAGEHEIKISKPGLKAIVSHVELAPQSEGDQSLDLRGVFER